MALGMQVLDGKEDALQLASTHTQATGDQRSLRAFLQPVQAGRPGIVPGDRDDDFQTPPVLGPPPAMSHQSSHPRQHQQLRPDQAIGGGCRQGDMRSFLMPKGRS